MMAALTLSAKKLKNFQALCPKGKVPEWPNPDSNTAYDIEAAIQKLLETERTRNGLKKMSSTRRAFFGVSTLNACFKGDGLIAGVAINDPELILAAIEGAKAMRLSAAAKILMKAKRSFPPQASWKSIRKREAWFETSFGQKAAAKLEVLTDELMDAEGSPGFVSSCLLFALANPAEFFEMGTSKAAK